MGSVRKGRRATFAVQKVDGVRRFTPVNKRAKRLAERKRTLVRKDLRKIKQMGYRVSESPSLRAIHL